MNAALCTFLCRFGIGDRVLAIGSRGVVIAVTFSSRKTNPQYEVRFDTGGATNVLDEVDLRSIEDRAA